MTIQIINLTYHDIFKRYSDSYKIFRDVYQPGLLGLEIRSISGQLAGKVRQVVLHENEICYKSAVENEKATSLLITGSIKSIKEISRKILSAGDEGLGYKIVNVIKNFEEYNLIEYNIGDKEFRFEKAYTMGILNITPDSFSDGGKFYSPDSAVSHGLEMIEQGADIIDIGGESSRPGSEPVNADEEIRRVVPVIDRLIKQKPGTIISVDTTKEKVADAVLSHGAKIINDISACNFEPGILDVVKNYNSALILMHMKGIPKDMQTNPYYEDVVKEVYDFFQEKTRKIIKAGIKNIFIDPGIGFGKTAAHNIELLRRLGDFKGLGYPILIGVSRKNFIGKMLDLNIGERDEATAIVESLAVNNGARIIRTHNIKYGVQVCNILNNIM